MRHHQFQDGPFFRADEQAATWLPLGNEGEAGNPDRPRRKAAGREARAERPLPVRLGKAIQEMLSREKPLLTA